MNSIHALTSEVMSRFHRRFFYNNNICIIFEGFWNSFSDKFRMFYARATNLVHLWACIATRKHSNLSNILSIRCFMMHIWNKNLNDKCISLQLAICLLFWIYSLTLPGALLTVILICFFFFSARDWWGVKKIFCSICDSKHMSKACLPITRDPVISQVIAQSFWKETGRSGNALSSQNRIFLL